jgi:hypothetical protein
MRRHVPAQAERTWEMPLDLRVSISINYRPGYVTQAESSFRPVPNKVLSRFSSKQVPDVLTAVRLR